MTLHDIVQKSDTIAGRLFDLLVLALIVFSIVTLSVETLPGLSPVAIWWLHISEIVVTGLFTLEYILRIFTTPRKRDYIFSFYGIIDFIAIVPFYLSLGIGLFDVDLRALRMLRLLRIFRTFKVTKYNDASVRFGKALAYAKEEIIIFLFITVMLIYLASVGIYHFEHHAQPDKFQSIPQSLWWALLTLATLGYDGVYPVTLGGKIFTFFILICGLGVVAVPAGIVSAALSKVIRGEDRGKQR